MRALNRSLKQNSLPRSGIAPHLVAHLKHCAVALVKPENRSEEPETISDQRTHNGAGSKIDKSVLTISEPKTDHLSVLITCPGFPATTDRVGTSK